MATTSRWGSQAVEDMEFLRNKYIPPNTQKCYKYTWHQFSAFCNEKNYKLTSSTSVQELADIMRDWAVNMRKQNGDDYKESVVKTIWNVTARQLQQKYYNEFHVSINPINDVEFKAARDARDAKRRELQSNPSKRKSSAGVFTTEEQNAILNHYDESTPTGLQKKFYHVISLELAWRGGEAAYSLLEHFQYETDSESNKTGRIEYNANFTQQNTRVGRHRFPDSKWLTPNHSNPSLCAVRLLHKLIDHRGPDVKTNRLFLTPNPYWQASGSKGWYKNSPVGKNEIAKWTSKTAEEVGLDTKHRKICNFSNCLTARRITRNQIFNSHGYITSIPIHKAVDSSSQVEEILPSEVNYLLDSPALEPPVMFKNFNGNSTTYVNNEVDPGTVVSVKLEGIFDDSSVNIKDLQQDNSLASSEVTEETDCSTAPTSFNPDSSAGLQPQTTSEHFARQHSLQGISTIAEQAVQAGSCAQCSSHQIELMKKKDKREEELLQLAKRESEAKLAALTAQAEAYRAMTEVLRSGATNVNIHMGSVS